MSSSFSAAHPVMGAIGKNCPMAFDESDDFCAYFVNAGNMLVITHGRHRHKTLTTSSPFATALFRENGETGEF
jgi:hypothetical protein